MSIFFNKMSYKKILYIGLIVIFLGAVSFFSFNYFKKDNFGSDKNTAINGVAEKEITYIINKGEKGVNQYQIEEISEKETVFSLLEKLAQKENFELKTKSYDFGIFINSIDKVENGENNKYWQYWVNDKLGEVAADKKDVKFGDKVEWKFEVPPQF